jgi:hypothetical protein
MIINNFPPAIVVLKKHGRYPPGTAIARNSGPGLPLPPVNNPEHEQADHARNQDHDENGPVNGRRSDPTLQGQERSQRRDEHSNLEVDNLAGGPF